MLEDEPLWGLSDDCSPSLSSRAWASEDHLPGLAMKGWPSPPAVRFQEDSPGF